MTDQPGERDAEDLAAFLENTREQRKKDPRELPISDNPPEPPNSSAATEPPKRHGFFPRRDR